MQGVSIYMVTRPGLLAQGERYLDAGERGGIWYPLSLSSCHPSSPRVNGEALPTLSSQGLWKVAQE